MRTPRPWRLGAPSLTTSTASGCLCLLPCRRSPLVLPPALPAHLPNLQTGPVVVHSARGLSPDAHAHRLADDYFAAPTRPAPVRQQVLMSHPRRGAGGPIRTVNEDEPVMVDEAEQWEIHQRTWIHRRLAAKPKNGDKRQGIQRAAF